MDGSLFDKRFVIVAGKGGVGKSTITSALALCAARRGKRVLVAELGGKERAARLLGHDADVGYEVTRVRDNIDVINVQPPEAMHEYGLMKLKFEKVYRAVFENPVMRSLTRMLPGMNELVLIGKAWHLEQELDETGEPRWDFIVVDAPATGHGISLLVLPHVITQTVKVGPLAEETGYIRDLLVDKDRTVMNIVTLPEEMPVSETLELRARMEDTLRIAPGYLFVNAIWPPTPTPTQIEITHRADGQFDDQRHQNVVATNKFMIRRRQAQDRYLERLRTECDLPRIEIPYQFTERFDVDAVDAISRRIDAGLAAHESGSAEAAHG